MKRFRFSLQPLVTLRSYEELRAQEAFAASVQAHAQAGRELAAVRARVAALAQSLAQARGQPFSARGAAEALAGYRAECAREGEAENAVAQAEKLLQRRRGEYLTAHRGVEVLARLETRARARHGVELRREEQAGYDERAARAACHGGAQPAETAPLES